MASTAFSTLMKPGSGYDRNYGGTRGTIVADPYISGYHFIKVVTLPNQLQKFVRNSANGNNSSISGDDQIKQTLQGSCLSVTPPGGTLNKAEFVGLGGVKWSVPTNIDYGNTLTIKFLEFSTLPILSIFHGWVSMIRDYRTGTSQLNSDGAYTKSEYAGTIVYWTTKPDGRSVEYAACYTGLFPLKDPQDLYSGDLTAVDKLEVDIEFNVDWVWHEKWVYDKAQGYANEYHSISTPNAYRSNPGRGVDQF